MTPPPRPTPAELEILRLPWENVPSTVREIQERMEQQRPTGYTTSLQLPQFMPDKGLVRRDATARSHVYAPEPPAGGPAGEWSTSVMVASDPLVGSADASSAHELRRRVEPLLPGLVGLWGAGVLLLSLRALGGWALVQRLRRSGLAGVPAAIESTLARLVGALRVSAPVRLYESALVQVPTVIGWLRPVILLPASALTGLSAGQLELILAHELAHIRRGDYLLNLLQTAVETLLFYHPAVWWVGKTMRLERENCCDDVAVSACGNALTYARALTELEQLRCSEPQLALAANGGSLIDRI